MQKGRITTDYIVKVDDASSSARGHLLPADRELSLSLLYDYTLMQARLLGLCISGH